MNERQKRVKFIQGDREAAWSEVGIRRSGGTGTEAIMYLYIIACLSSSFHCAFVKGNPREAAIPTSAINTTKHEHFQCLRKNRTEPSLSLSLSSDPLSVLPYFIFFSTKNAYFLINQQ